MADKERTDELFRKIQDIDARLLRIEDDRRETVRTLVAMFDELPAYVIFKGEDGRIIFINKYAAQVVGKRREELVGTALVDCWPAAIRCFNEFRDALACEGSIRLPNGAVHRVLAWTKPIKDTADRVMGLLIFALDLDSICDSCRAHSA